MHSLTDLQRAVESVIEPDHHGVYQLQVEDWDGLLWLVNSYEAWPIGYDNVVTPAKVKREAKLWWQSVEEETGGE